MLNVRYQEMMTEGGKEAIAEFLQNKGFKSRNRPELGDQVWRTGDNLFLEIDFLFSRGWYNRKFEGNPLRINPSVRIGANLYDDYNANDIIISKEEMEKRQERLKDLMYELQEHLSTECNVITHLYEVEQERDLSIYEGILKEEVRTL